MDADTALRLISFFILILLSGFFSGSETAMFSLSRVHLLRLVEERHPKARLLQRLLEQPRKIIATIFIGNDFVNIGASAILTAMVSETLVKASPVQVTIISTLISVTLILMLGEIIPKNIAAHIPQRWASIAAFPIQFLATAMAPLRFIIQRIADGMVSIVGGDSAHQNKTVGEEEFRSMVDMVSRHGEIEEREKRLIHNVFEFGTRRVIDVMTPVDNVFALNYNLSIPSILKRVKQNRYSRIPVYQDRRERIIGVLYAKDLIAMSQGLGAQPDRLKTLLHEPYFVPKSMRCDQLFRVFRKRRIHLALVVDEYGKCVGLVTMEDLLEVVFGEIADEKELPFLKRAMAQGPRTQETIAPEPATAKTSMELEPLTEVDLRVPPEEEPK